jgi:hypothetical protein
MFRLAQLTSDGTGLVRGGEIERAAADPRSASGCKPLNPYGFQAVGADLGRLVPDRGGRGRDVASTLGPVCDGLMLTCKLAISKGFTGLCGSQAGFRFCGREASL